MTVRLLVTYIYRERVKYIHRVLYKIILGKIGIRLQKL